MNCPNCGNRMSPSVDLGHYSCIGREGCRIGIQMPVLSLWVEGAGMKGIEFSSVEDIIRYLKLRSFE